MNDRKLRKVFPDWITQYLDYAKNTESPTNYHIWMAIGMINGAMRRQCYMRWGHEKIYPNMYIVLVGPSGKARKGVALGLGLGIYSQLDLPTTPDSLSIEKLISNIKATHTEYADPETGEAVSQCATVTFSKELVNFLRKQDIKFLGVLTDWYDSADTWRYETFTRGLDYIDGVCYSLIGATAPDWIQSILPQEAIGGGFTSRIIFVVEKDKSRTIALPKMTEEAEQVRRWLVHDLYVIKEKVGNFHFSPEAEAAYASWYTDQETDADKDRYAVSDERFRGYCERRATHIKKICMAVCASSGEREDMEITIADFKRSRQYLESIEPNMPLVFGGTGVSDLGRIAMNVLHFIRQNSPCTRQKILMHFYREFGSTSVFDQIAVLLEQSGAISVTRKIGGDTTYMSLRN